MGILLSNNDHFCYIFAPNAFQNAGVEHSLQLKGLCSLFVRPIVHNDYMCSDSPACCKIRESHQNQEITLDRGDFEWPHKSNVSTYCHENS